MSVSYGDSGRRAWIVKRHLAMYQGGKVVQQPEASFLNEDGPIKPHKSRTQAMAIKTLKKISGSLQLAA